MRKLPAVIELLLINAPDLRDPPSVPWDILSFAALRMKELSRCSWFNGDGYPHVQSHDNQHGFNEPFPRLGYLNAD